MDGAARGRRKTQQRVRADDRGASADVEHGGTLRGPEVGVIIDDAEADIELFGDLIVGRERGGEALVEARGPLEIDRGENQRSLVGGGGACAVTL